MSSLRLIHAWGGALLSLIVMMMAFTGSILVFKDDLMGQTTVVHGSHGKPSLSLSAIVHKAELSFADEGLKSITFSRSQNGAHKVYLEDKAYGLISSSGDQVQTFEPNQEVLEWVFSLHHNLFLGEAGGIILGICGFLSLVFVVTGIVLAWPSLRLWHLHLWPDSYKRGSIVKVHRDLGLLSAPLLIILLITGTVLALSSYTRPFFSSLDPNRVVTSEVLVSFGSIRWSKVFSEVEAYYPNAQIRMVIWPSAPDKPAIIRVRQKGEWHTNGRTQIWIDPSSSQVVHTIDAHQLGWGDRLFNSFWPVHAAKIGDGPSSFVTKLITSFGGLCLFLLSFYGMITFIRKMAPKSS